MFLTSVLNNPILRTMLFLCCLLGGVLSEKLTSEYGLPAGDVRSDYLIDVQNAGNDVTFGTQESQDQSQNPIGAGLQTLPTEVPVEGPPPDQDQLATGRVPYGDLRQRQRGPYDNYAAELCNYYRQLLDRYQQLNDQHSRLSTKQVNSHSQPIPNVRPFGLENRYQQGVSQNQQQLHDSYQQPIVGPYEIYSSQSKYQNPQQDRQYIPPNEPQLGSSPQPLQRNPSGQTPLKYILLSQRNQAENGPKTSSSTYLSHPLPLTHQPKIQVVDSPPTQIGHDGATIVLPVPNDFRRGSYGPASSTFVSKDVPRYDQQNFASKDDAHRLSPPPTAFLPYQK